MIVLVVILLLSYILSNMIRNIFSNYNQKLNNLNKSLEKRIEKEIRNSKEKDNLIYSICFCGKFLQEINSQPIGTNVLYISYYKDYVVKNNDKSKVKDIVIKYTIIIDDTTKYYRKYIYNTNLNVYDNSIFKLPCEYMLPDSGSLIAKLTPDACIIC